MGNCCGSQEEERPLLGSGPVGARTGTLSDPAPVQSAVSVPQSARQHNPIDHRSFEERPLLGSGPVGARTGTLSDPTPVQSAVSVPQSARQHNPIDHRSFETSIEIVCTVKLNDVPIQTVDKTFKDISKLYNEIVESFRALEQDIHKFKAEFVEETAGIPVLASCVRILRQRCGDDSNIVLKRTTKDYLELIYDKITVQNHCYGDADKLIRCLDYFKRACDHIRDILVRAPQLETNAKIVLGDEEKFKREIMKADIPDVPGAMKSFLENFSKMRTITAGSDTIHRDVKKKFTEFLEASKGFFRENEP